MLDACVIVSLQLRITHGKFLCKAEMLELGRGCFSQQEPKAA